MPETARIRLLWHPQAQFAGYLLAEQRPLSQPQDIALVTEPVDFDDPPITALLEGRVDFAVASPAHVLESADPAALSVILTIQQRSPLIYAARSDSGIATAADLRHRRIAVWPGGEDLELRWLLHKALADQNAADRVETTDTLAALLAGEVDVAQTTSYHEWHHAVVRLGAEGVVGITAEPHGASLVKDGLIMRRDMFERRADYVNAVVCQVLAGWTEAFDHPAEAVSACAIARPEMPAAEHERQLADIRALSLTGVTCTHGLGYPDPEHGRAAAQALIDTGHAVPDDVGQVMDERPWQAAAPELRRRDWEQTS